MGTSKCGRARTNYIFIDNAIFFFFYEKEKINLYLEPKKKYIKSFVVCFFTTLKVQILTNL
jgi:hypothetical protein